MRQFTVEVNDEEVDITARAPASAASKALTKYIKLGGHDEVSVKVKVQEKGKNKVITYDAIRRRLATPKVTTITSKSGDVRTITSRYETTIKSARARRTKDSSERSRKTIRRQHARKGSSSTSNNHKADGRHNNKSRKRSRSRNNAISRHSRSRQRSRKQPKDIRKKKSAVSKVIFPAL